MILFRGPSFIENKQEEGSKGKNKCKKATWNQVRVHFLEINADVNTTRVMIC